jgi:hypothetical protein
MRYKFNSPTYAEYAPTKALIASCVQNLSAADPITYQITYEVGSICPAIFHCVLNGIDNGTMANYAAGSTILGFVSPTLSLFCDVLLTDCGGADTDHPVHDWY